MCQDGSCSKQKNKNKSAMSLEENEGGYLSPQARRVALVMNRTFHKMYTCPYFA